MADEIRDLRLAIDKFFDKYNDIRGQVEGLMETEIETQDSVVSALREEGKKIVIYETLNRLKLSDPEFQNVWGEIMRHRGKLETLVAVKEQLKGILKPKQENENGDL